jgi:integrase/recombinase XerD
MLYPFLNVTNMSLSIKAVLRPSKKKNNKLIPIYFRIINQRQSYFISINQFTEEKHWNEALGEPKLMHPNYPGLKALIKRINQQIHFFIESKRIEGYNLSINDLRNEIKNMLYVGPRSKTKLFEYYDQKIESLKNENRIGYMATFKESKRSLTRFRENKDLYMDEIDLDFIKKYETHLINRKNSLSTISVYLRTFRTLYIEAQKEGKI